jgi:hypothetical protein
VRQLGRLPREVTIAPTSNNYSHGKKEKSSGKEGEESKEGHEAPPLNFRDF